MPVLCWICRWLRSSDRRRQERPSPRKRRNAMETVTIGSATLVRGDARDVLASTTDKAVDFIFTDPPFGHRNNDNGDLISRREVALGHGPVRAGRPIANDGREEADELVRFLFNEARRLLPPGAVLACCCGGGGVTMARWTLWMEELLGHKMTVVWDKGFGMGWHYRRSYEVVLTGQRPGGKSRWYDTTRRVTNVIRPDDGIKRIIPKAEDHPTPKPPALAGHFIALHSQPGHLVMDPFMGGGSTAEAAILAERRFLGVELDARFFDMACQRAERAEKLRRMLTEGGANQNEKDGAKVG
ncbi:site-specific DNA-methyltransferase [Azospirillum sp. Vi22]|nr:site-specific DNA-methyltransferase [Azospirillum baldaniorum]